MFSLLILLPLLIILYKKQEPRQKQLRAFLDPARDESMIITEIDGFSPTMRSVGFEHSYIFAMDDIMKKCYFSRNGVSMGFDYNNIISVQRVDRKAQVRSYSSSSVVNSMIGVACGYEGVYGAVSDPRVEGFYAITVKILLRDMYPSVIEIPCFNAQSMIKSSKPVRSNNPICAKCIRQADSIVDAITVAIDKAKQ